MSYGPPEDLTPEQEAQQELAEALNDRLNLQLVEGIGLSAYDANRVVQLVAREFESTDLTHEAGTATWKLARSAPTQVEINRELFEQAVRGQLLEYLATFTNWHDAPDVDDVVDQIAAIAVEHHPFI